MDILVSIVIPIYNVGQYLKTCLDSVVRQSYGNIEIILVDDGSTDEGGGICDEYAELDNRVQVIHKANGGLSSARNCGMEIAKGAYIAFVDSDDFIHNRFVEILLSIAIGNDSDIAVGDFEVFINEDKCKDKELTDWQIEQAQVLNEKQLYDNDFIHKETTCLTVAWGKIYKRELFNDIIYPIGKINEDTHTTYRVMDKANRVVYLKEPLYFWRERADSISRGKFTTKQLSGLEALTEQFSYFNALKRQRYVEIVTDAWWDWFFYCYNRMNEQGIDYKEALKPFYEYMCNNIKYVKLTKSVGLTNWLRYRYLVYYKLRKWFK